MIIVDFWLECLRVFFRQPVFASLLEQRWWILLAFVVVAIISKLFIVNHDDVPPGWRWREFSYGARFIPMAFLSLYLSDIASGRVDELSFIVTWYETTHIGHLFIAASSVVFGVGAFVYLLCFVGADDDF